MVKTMDECILFNTKLTSKSILKVYFNSVIRENLTKIV